MFRNSTRAASGNIPFGLAGAAYVSEAQPRTWRQIFVALCLAVGFTAQLAILQAQTASTNCVLELDGTGGYVELPPNIFNDLEEATVEAWVRWDEFGGTFKRVFNYGDARRDFSITSYETEPTLVFVLSDGQGQLHGIVVPYLLRT